jgi:hypothetical protein
MLGIDLFFDFDWVDVVGQRRTELPSGVIQVGEICTNSGT